MTHGKDFWDNEKLAKILRRGGVVVMPTDTIYGLVGRAENKETVERIYKIKGRAPDKPCIILIGDVAQIEKFGIILSAPERNFFEQRQPRPTSVILDCENQLFEYLHRGTNTLAFRLPASEKLRALLLETGPLIAPSANIEGEPPARNITEAKRYFGDSVDPVRGREGSQRVSTSNGVDLYIDGGVVAGKASRIVKLKKDGSVTVLRD